MDPPMPHTSATRFNFSDIHERLQRLSLLRYHFNLHGMTTDLQEDALELANGSFGAMAVAANNQHQNHQQQQRHQPCNHNQFAQAHDHQHHGSISTGNHTNSYRYHGQDLVASIRGHYVSYLLIAVAQMKNKMRWKNHGKVRSWRGSNMSNAGNMTVQPTATKADETPVFLECEKARGTDFGLYFQMSAKHLADFDSRILTEAI